MLQLMMWWKRQPVAQPVFPASVRPRRFVDTHEEIEKWLTITRHHLLAPDASREAFEETMRRRPGLDLSDIWFFEEAGQSIATIAPLLDLRTMHGYIHMVGLLPDYRGKGLGTLLNAFAMNQLYERGCIHAHLTTDDWRTPAIRSYLRVGFLPVLHAPDMEERWLVLLSQFGIGEIEAVGEHGDFLRVLRSRIL